MIDRFGADGAARRWLPSLLHHGAARQLLPDRAGPGSDAASLRTRARREGDRYVLSGTKAFISGGGASDLYLVMGRTGGEGPSGISRSWSRRTCRASPSASRSRSWAGTPSRPAASTFDEFSVPVAHRLGAEGEGFRIAMRGLDGGRVNIAACSLGGARACLERALAYVKERRQFGRPLAEFQHTAVRARRHGDRARGRPPHGLARRRRARPRGARRHPGLRHGQAPRHRRRLPVVNAALQLHGGYGYLRDYQIERYLSDVRVHQILEGTNEIMRLIIARRLLAG